MWHQFLRCPQRVLGQSQKWGAQYAYLLQCVWTQLGGVALSGATSHEFHAEENLNLRTAKALRIALSSGLLSIVDEVIE